MKLISKLMTGVMLLGASVLIQSCTKAGEEVDIIFPEIENVTGETAGEVKTLAFDAAVNWSLNSDASWIKFQDGDSWMSSISGKKGEQTVKYKIEETGWGLEETKANITLAMDQESEIIATVVRPAKQPEVSFCTFDQNNDFAEVEFDEENDELYLTMDTFASAMQVRLGVKCSVDWTLDLPKWVSKENATEFAGSDETQVIWIRPEYKAYEFVDVMEGDMVISIKDKPELKYTVKLKADGANTMMQYNGGLATHFHYSSYGLYELPEDKGYASEREVFVRSGATEYKAGEDVWGNTCDASFQHNNLIGLSYEEDASGNRVYRRLENIDNGYGYIVFKDWLQVAPVMDDSQVAWVNRYTGNKSVMEYKYKISCIPNKDANAGERNAILLALPLSHFNAEGDCNDVELMNADGSLKAEFEKYIVGSVRQDGAIPKSTLLHPAEALQCGATMRLMDPNDPEDKAYMDARIAEMSGESFEAFEGRIVYENMYELVYEHPSSSAWAFMAKISAFDEREEEKYQKPVVPHAGVWYSPKDEDGKAMYPWIGLDVDDYTCVSMRPKPVENFETLDGYLVIRPLNVHYETNEAGEQIKKYSEPKSYQFIRCILKSDVVPDNFDEIKPNY